MINLNGIEFSERHEKPAIGGKVGLRAFFYNDGQLVDPYDISSVSIFTYQSYASSALFDATSNLLIAQPLMQFAPSGTAGPADADDYSAEWGNPDDPQTGGEFGYASGVFKLGTGDFVAPLALDTRLSGVWEEYKLEASANVDAATTYIDVWTVKLLAGSDYQCFIHRWGLNEDTFFSITQPLLAKTSARLSNKHMRYGEIADLKVPIEVTIENKDIDESIINTLKSNLVTNPKFKIVKVNDNPTLNGPFVVLNFDDTQTVNVTADGTLLYKWNTGAITTSTDFGEAKGTYAIQVRYSVNDQTIISPRFYVTLN